MGGCVGGPAGHTSMAAVAAAAATTTTGSFFDSLRRGEPPGGWGVGGGLSAVCEGTSACASTLAAGHSFHQHAHCWAVSGCWPCSASWHAAHLAQEPVMEEAQSGRAGGPQGGVH